MSNEKLTMNNEKKAKRFINTFRLTTKTERRSYERQD
jgi:hypothetical protein